MQICSMYNTRFYQTVVQSILLVILPKIDSDKIDLCALCGLAKLDLLISVLRPYIQFKIYRIRIKAVKVG